MTPLFLLRIRSGEQSYVSGHWPGRYGPRFVPMWLARLRQRIEIRRDRGE